MQLGVKNLYGINPFCYKGKSPSKSRSVSCQITSSWRLPSVKYLSAVFLSGIVNSMSHIRSHRRLLDSIAVLLKMIIVNNSVFINKYVSDRH